jgi:hypothetical protein
MLDTYDPAQDFQPDLDPGIFDDTTCNLNAITTQTVNALPSILQANTIYELTADQEITLPITFGGDCIAIVGKHPTNQNGKPVITSQNNR